MTATRAELPDEASENPAKKNCLLVCLTLAMHVDLLCFWDS